MLKAYHFTRKNAGCRTAINFCHMSTRILIHLSHQALLSNLFYWRIVDLKCVNFCCTGKWLSYIHIYVLSHVLFHYGLSQDIEYTISCAVQQDLVVYPFYIKYPFASANLKFPIHSLPTVPPATTSLFSVLFHKILIKKRKKKVFIIVYALLSSIFLTRKETVVGFLIGESCPSIHYLKKYLSIWLCWHLRCIMRDLLLQHMDSLVVVYRFQSAQAQLFCGMWDLSSLTKDQTCIPCTEGRFLTTGPTENSHQAFIIFPQLYWGITDKLEITYMF